MGSQDHAWWTLLGPGMQHAPAAYSVISQPGRYHLELQAHRGSRSSLKSVQRMHVSKRCKPADSYWTFIEKPNTHILGQCPLRSRTCFERLGFASAGRSPASCAGAAFTFSFPLRLRGCCCRCFWALLLPRRSTSAASAPSSQPAAPVSAAAWPLLDRLHFCGASAASSAAAVSSAASAAAAPLLERLLVCFDLPAPRPRDALGCLAPSAPSGPSAGPA